MSESINAIDREGSRESLGNSLNRNAGFNEPYKAKSMFVEDSGVDNVAKSYNNYGRS